MRSKIHQILNQSRDSEILLVVPPFSLLDLPCISLDILKTIAESMQIRTTVLYSNLLFADFIGVDKYKRISMVLMSMHTMLGERIFANAANATVPLLGFDFLKNQDENFNEVFSKSMSLEEVEDIALKAKKWVQVLSAEIASFNYKIVGVTTGHQQTNAAVSIIREIKKRVHDVICTIGGAACDGDMAEGIKSICSNVDYVFSGESENSWKEFLFKYKNDQLPDRGAIIRSDFLTNLDEIQCSSDAYSDYYHQLSVMGIIKEEETSILYESSRGCWWGEHHKCTFCGVNGWNKH